MPEQRFAETDALPTAAEALGALALAVKRLARSTALSISALVVFITGVELLRLVRLAANVGRGAAWQDGAIQILGEVLLLQLIAALSWYGAPYLMVRAYGPLIRDGRLVPATVVAGPHTVLERLRVDDSFLVPIESLLVRVVPTQLVNYRADSAAGSRLGGLYADEVVCGNPDLCWALNDGRKHGTHGVALSAQDPITARSIRGRTQARHLPGTREKRDTMGAVSLSERVAPPVLLGLGSGAALLVTAALAAPSGSILSELLRQKMGFSAADLRALDAGSAVIRRLDTPIHEELAYVGAVYLDAPSGRFVERFRDIVRFEKGLNIPQIARFSTPPRLEDLASLTLPRADVATLASCRPGDCDVKLSAAAMRRFQDDVDWSSPEAAPQANEVARTMIFDLVRAYQKEGNAALGHYDDGDDPLPVAEHFRALLASNDPLPVPVPELLAYLDDYPHRRLDGAEDIFYWTVVDFGLKSTIRVNHVTIYTLGGSPPPSHVRYVIAIKQLYASHYFHTTLELRFLADDDRRAARGTSLISITRSRSDGMTGFKGFFLRPIIRSRSRDAILSYLDQVRRQVERPARAAP